MSFASLWMKYQFKKSDQKRDAGLETPASIKRFDDILYGQHKKWHLLDVYMPKGQTKKRPTIINIHGGGWIYGTKETYQYYLMSLAERGFTVVNPNYGLAPKYKFPSQLQDINQVVQWICDHEEVFGFDLNNLFIVGDSAGAHLAALYMNLSTNKVYEKQLGISSPEKFKVSALALNCGVYDFPDMETVIQSRPQLLDFIGKKQSKEQLEKIKPLNYMTEDFPPTFLMSSTGDFLLDHIAYMQEKLQALNIDHVVKIYGDEAVKPNHVFHCDIKNDIARQCNDDECDFFKSFIR